jgi:hypothetical protein
VVVFKTNLTLPNQVFLIMPTKVEKYNGKLEAEPVWLTPTTSFVIHCTFPTPTKKNSVSEVFEKKDAKKSANKNTKKVLTRAKKYIGQSH